jgi:uncharacterized membrane protein YbhN (UPF0104 family)
MNRLATVAALGLLGIISISTLGWFVLPTADLPWWIVLPALAVALSVAIVLAVWAIGREGERERAAVRAAAERERAEIRRQFGDPQVPR